MSVTATAPTFSSATRDVPIAPTPISPIAPSSDLAEVIAAADDPEEFLMSLIESVAARAPYAADQGRMLSHLRNRIGKVLDTRIRPVLLAFASDADGNPTPGRYPGFSITPQNGRRSVDYALLMDQYPDVYDEVVAVSEPGVSLTYSDNY